MQDENTNLEYNLPDGIDFYSQDFVLDLMRYPAVEGTGRDVYILKDNVILCLGRVGSSYRSHVMVYLENQEALEIFRDDEGVKIAGKNAPFPFYDASGWYVFGRITDESEERGIGLTIVDKMAFDLGIASKMRYSHIPSFGYKGE